MVREKSTSINMTLSFFKNNKSDNRMVEYDQAIARLAVERVEAEQSLSRVRGDIAEIGSRHAVLLNEIKEAEEKLNIFQQEIVNVTKRGVEKAHNLSLEQQESEKTINKKTEELVHLEEDITSLKEKIEVAKKTLDSFMERVSEVRKLLDGKKEELDIQAREKRKIEGVIDSLKELKKGIVDIVTSSEKSRDYLAEKEQFLNRKEADLLKYEDRLTKQREEAGNNNRMQFK